MPPDNVEESAPDPAEIVRLPDSARIAEIATSRLVEPVVASEVPSRNTGQEDGLLGVFENLPIKPTKTCLPAGTSTV